jgi:muramoyltetrapeptide carboxypeptidase
MNRRDFIGGLGSAGCLASLALGAKGALSSTGLIKPPRLSPGDTIGLVNPATAAFETMPIDILTESLEALGLRVVKGESYFDRRGYFAGTDEDRAGDINRFFADTSVKALLARGGWGASRVLPLLDYELIRNNPKVVLGYSDVTALLLAIHAKTGLVTFHAPYPPTQKFSADYLRRTVFDAEAVRMENPKEVDDDETVQTEDRIQVLTPGTARGRIFGGNLTVLTTIVGSDYLPDWRGAILFLEDVDEAVYRIDRMLNQLKLAGVLEQIRGFVFGRCTDCPPGGGYGSLTLEDVLDDYIKPLGIPAWRGTMIGHIDRQFTVPLGVEVEIDAGAGVIQMLEPGVA